MTTTFRKAVVAPMVVYVVLLCAVFPIFMKKPDSILALTVNPSMDSDCPSGSACYVLELQNSGPWPVSIDILELQFYPSLIGASVIVDWLGSGPDKFLALTPFSGLTYTLLIRILGGLRPPERVYMILTANVAVLYVVHRMVLHSGER